MRLLHCDLSGEAAPLLEEFYDEIPPYAVLSHRWGKATEEVSLKDIETGADISKKEGYRKFQYCCQQALEDGFKYVWIDTCCIDKSSSAELSEAINSMYNWYMRSQVCYAYLNDVSSPVSGTAESSTVNAVALEEENSSFRKSAWFTRGWTLQELIAPENVRFFDQYWRYIGDKQGLASLVSEITRIDPEVLTSQVKPSSVAQRMSWAAGRKTTRLEDRAYSLMGIFGVNMPPLYGEGHKAFIRLQEEIMRQSFDHSLFAWEPTRSGCGLLAESPDQFSNCGNVVHISYDRYVLQLKVGLENPDYTQTNFGTRIHLPLERTSVTGVYRTSLACTRQSEDQKERGQHNPLVHIDLLKEPGPGFDTYSRYFFGESGKVPWIPYRAYIQGETIYIGRSRESRFEHMPTPKLLVDLRVFTSAEQDLLCCYYGGKVRQLTMTPRFSFIDIGLEKNEDSVVVIFAGYFFKPDSATGDRDTRVDVYAIFGFYEGHIWTDFHENEIWDENSKQGKGHNNVGLAAIYEIYLDRLKTGSVALATSTVRRWTACNAWRMLNKHRKFHFVGSVDLHKLSLLRYQVEVNFSSTPHQGLSEIVA
ncbi:Heterokaryon incompatibility protein (HET) domain containing protein [Hyaloscypha variabilis]